MSEIKEWFGGRAVDDDEARIERRHLRKFVGFILALGVALGLLGLAGCAGTQPQASPAVEVAVPMHVLERGRTSIRLMPGACVEPRSLAYVARTAPALAERFRAIESTWLMTDGTRRPFAGCWIELSAEEAGEPAFGLIFEDGARLLIRKSDFSAGPGV